MMEIIEFAINVKGDKKNRAGNKKERREKRQMQKMHTMTVSKWHASDRSVLVNLIPQSGKSTPESRGINRG